MNLPTVLIRRLIGIKDIGNFSVLLFDTTNKNIPSILSDSILHMTCYNDSLSSTWSFFQIYFSPIKTAVQQISSKLKMFSIPQKQINIYKCELFI